MSSRSTTARTVPSRRAILASSAMTGVLALAACGPKDAVPTIPAQPSGASAGPAADRERISAVVADIAEALRGADAKKDPKKLAPRIVGTAALARTRAYQIMAKVPGYAPAQLSPTSSVIVPLTSTGETFPRVAIALVDDKAGGGQRDFVALTQKDARSPYTTWGWALQSAGVKKLPTVQPDSIGAAPVPYDASDLVLSPKAALARYAAVLSYGAAADKEKLIVTDPFQEAAHKGIQNERADLNKGVAPDSLATVHEDYTVVGPAEYIGIRSSDGGAIVMASMRSKRTMKTVGNATITVKDTDASGKPFAEVKLTGKTTFTKEFVRDYSEVVVLWIPKKGSGEKIQPFAATKSLLAASGS